MKFYSFSNQYTDKQKRLDLELIGMQGCTLEMLSKKSLKQRSI